jgi:hypothetical protein
MARVMAPFLVTAAKSVGGFLHKRCLSVVQPWTMRSSAPGGRLRRNKHGARDRKVLFALEQRMQRGSARLSACPCFHAWRLGSTLNVHAATRHTRSSPAYGWRPHARSVRCVGASGTAFARRALTRAGNHRWCDAVARA